ncbi:MAG: hypothetical protein IRZ00_16170 [Gemmatimonadetes bacterium]|nr:hypothetical protein [Gemmatimonadota bacterium]
MSRSRLIVALAAALALPACRAGGPRGEVAGVSPSRYADALVALRRIAATAKSPAEFQAQKAQALARLGVTEAQLQAFARAHATDVALMSAVWDTVEARLNRPAQPGPPPAQP